MMFTKSNGRESAQDGLYSTFDDISSFFASALQEVEPVVTVGSIFDQFRGSLTAYVAREVENTAEAVVQDELRAYRIRAHGRLAAVEAETQAQVQAAVDALRDAVLASVRERIQSASHDVAGHVSGLVKDLVSVPVEPVVAPLPAEAAASTPALDPSPVEATHASGTVEDARVAASSPQSHAPMDDQAQSQAVWLRLAAPLDLKAMMGFYHSLLEMTDVRILETVGSAAQGVSFLVAPRDAVSISATLQALPDVLDVQPAAVEPSVASKGAVSLPTPVLSVVLRPTSA